MKLEKGSEPKLTLNKEDLSSSAWENLLSDLGVIKEDQQFINHVSFNWESFNLGIKS